MHVHFYGVRGSIPTPGVSTVRYGGNTVCVEVELADGTIVVLDAGTGVRDLGKRRLKQPPTKPYVVLLTHLHWDHVIGIPFFGPIWLPDTQIKIHSLANEAQRRVLRERVLFDGIHFPVRAEDVPAKIEFLDDPAPEVLEVGSAKVRRIQLNHPGGAQGFRIDDSDGRSLAYLTDNELSPPGRPTTTLEDLADFSMGVDLLIHDAQYVETDMPAKHGWGHSTVTDVFKLGQRAGAKQLVLFHHDPDRDDDALDALGHRATKWFRDQNSVTKAIVAREGWEPILLASRRGSPRASNEAAPRTPAD
jgi:phosphoribosyl 1,2-cyclic phosphodiesterase